VITRSSRAQDRGRHGAALGEEDVEALLAQHDAEHLAHRGFVVDDQDLLGHGGAGW
jgi:hypothetical protein